MILKPSHAYYDEYYSYKGFVKSLPRRVGWLIVVSGMVKDGEMVVDSGFVANKNKEQHD